MTVLTAAIIFQCTQLGITVNIHGLSDWISSLQEQGDRYRRVGGKGRGVQSFGTQGRPDSHPIWAACATRADMLTLMSNLESLQFRVCKVTDQHARILPRVLVGQVAISPTRCRGPLVKATTQATYRIDGTMELERLADS